MAVILVVSILYLLPTSIVNKLKCHCDIYHSVWVIGFRESRLNKAVLPMTNYRNDIIEFKVEIFDQVFKKTSGFVLLTCI